MSIENLGKLRHLSKPVAHKGSQLGNRTLDQKRISPSLKPRRDPRVTSGRLLVSVLREVQVNLMTCLVNVDVSADNNPLVVKGRCTHLAQIPLHCY